MGLEPEIKCKFNWSTKKIEVWVKNATCKVLELSPPWKTPTEFIHTCEIYAVTCEMKYTHLQGQIVYRVGPLKMAYYNAKKRYEQATRPVLPWTPPETRVHICALEGGTKHEGELRIEGVPDVVGELEAWKSWRWKEEIQRLTSPSYHSFVWDPLQIVEAKCNRCPTPPCTNCTCGIYAGTETQAGGYGEVLGMLKQWGRFVQGHSGVKSQFAYPAWFLLKPGQEPLIDGLKQYGVPIKMMSPIVVWDPKEEGFMTTEGDEDEYRRD